MAPIRPQPPSPDSDPARGEAIAPGVRVPAAALRFAFARSSGPGGQNVNKLSTKAELRIEIDAIPVSGRVKGRLRRLAGGKIVGTQTIIDETGREHAVGGELILTSDEHRSQSRNKSECLDRLRDLIVAAMAEPKVRRATRPTRGSKERRLSEKKARGEIKRGRSRGDDA